MSAGGNWWGRLTRGSQAASDAAPAEARKQERLRANELWAGGRRKEAMDVLRRARLVHGPDSWLCLAQGVKYMEMGLGVPARDALHDAVELDPRNLDALEFFLEAAHKHPPVKGALTAVMRDLAGLLPLRPGFDLDAMAFLIPSMSDQRISEGIGALQHSEDRAARLASRLILADVDEWPALLEGQDAQDVLVARAVVELGRGNIQAATDTLADLPEDRVPARSVRLAIRRALRRDRNKQALKLLPSYRRARPDDNWAKGLAKRLNPKTKTLSHYQLATKGFPFRKPTSTPAYEPDPAKIFYCLHNSLPYHSAGYATRTHGLLRGIRAQGWDVQGVTRLGYPYDMPGREDLGSIESLDFVDGVPYHRLTHAPGPVERKNPIQGYVDRYAKALSQLAQAERPLILHAASNHWNGLTAVQAARSLGIQSVYEVRGLWEVTRGSRDAEWMGGGMYRYMARMETDAAKYADRVIAITGALRDELISRGVDAEKISLIPNGVEVSRFEPRPRNEELAARLGLQGKTVIGYVGSILDYEGLGLLIDAAHELFAERDDLAFLIVGDGAELELFRGRIEDEGLTGRVLFPGRVPHEEVEDYYSVIDICPFPRLPLPVCEMVSPLKPFEAFAMRKAVVASDVAALAEIVQDNVTGLLHTKGDARSLAAALRRLVEDPELRNRLADNGLAWVRAERDWQNLSSRVNEVYQSLGGVRQASE